MEKTYIAIDLKSFYASVECQERGLNPLTTNLIVADNSRTEKTVCLAVTPSLKQYRLSGRARLFEVVQKVRQINYERKQKIKCKFIEQELNNEKSEKQIQKVILNIKNKYGKNSILKGMNLIEGATTIERNNQVGGHRG